MQKYNNRNEVPDKYKWDLSDFYQNEEEFIKDLEKCQKKNNELKKYPGCTKDAKKLYEFLKLEIETIALCENLYVYAYLINDQELGNSKSIERKNKTLTLYSDIENTISFLAPELLKLTQEEYDKLFETELKLKEFKSDLDKIYREKDHILKEKEEVIANSLTNAVNHFDDFSSNLLNTEHDYGTIEDENGEKITIATNNYSQLMRNKDENIRKEVYDKFYKVINQYSNSNASYLNSFVSMQDTLSTLHNFEDSWADKLFYWNLNDNIFKKLVETTENNLSIFQKYINLKKKILGLKTMHNYDLHLELSESDIEYTIEEAQKLVKDSLKPLGEEYIEKFNKIIDNHYIDYCQYKGKCSGGYSFSTIDHDSRILMSFNGELNSVSTIAHEGGHNVHHQFVRENNSLQYRNPSSIVCEVASLTNECLLSSYLKDHGKNKQEKLSGIANILSVITSNLYGAVREGKMEQDFYNHVHNGNSLTKDYMDKLTIDSLKKYYGNTIILDDNAKLNWVTRSHYYMHFYLYSYAICISVACNVAKRVLDNDKEFLDKYIKFLKTGSDKWPSEAFAILGIDLNDSTVYQNAINYFNDMIDDFEKISKER